MHYLMIVGEVENHLQTLETTSAICIGRALEDTDSCSLGETRFDDSVRLVMTDARKSNIKAERALQLKRCRALAAVFFRLLHFLCEVHILARTQKGIVSPFSAAVTGVLNVALSLPSGRIQAPGTMMCV